MPPFVLTDAAIVAVAEAIKAICEVQKVTLENMTPEQKALQTQFFSELMKGPMILMQGFNNWLEKQLAK